MEYRPMNSNRPAKRITYVRLDATVSPIHKEKILKEIEAAASKGRKLTTSDIIREELDGRYLIGKKS
jgi:hypothetical protein